MESKNENKRKKEGKEDYKQRGKKGTDQRREINRKMRGRPEAILVKIGEGKGWL
jgi:hypothetical protein